MKKLLWILLFLIPVILAFGQDLRIKTATAADPSQNRLSLITITSGTQLNVPASVFVGGSLVITNNLTGFGTDNLLNNQTLTGNGSIINRVLGDARYFQSASTNQFVTTNNIVFVQAITNVTTSGDASLQVTRSGRNVNLTWGNSNGFLTASATNGFITGGGDVFTTSNNTFIVGRTNTFNGGLLTSNIVVRGSATIGTNAGFVVNALGNITKVGNDVGALWSIDSTAQSRFEGGNVTNFLIRNVNSLGTAIIELQVDGGSPDDAIRIFNNGIFSAEFLINSNVFNNATYALQGLAIGSGPVLSNRFSIVQSLNFGNILAAAQEDITVTIAGARTNSSVVLGLPPAPAGGLNFFGFVSNQNNVVIRAQNVGGIAIDAPAANYRITVDAW